MQRFGLELGIKDKDIHSRALESCSFALWLKLKRSPSTGYKLIAYNVMLISNTPELKCYTQTFNMNASETNN
jgi:hypothetical protein